MLWGFPGLVVWFVRVEGGGIVLGFIFGIDKGFEEKRRGKENVWRWMGLMDSKAVDGCWLSKL